ncbi:ovomucoid-like [Pelodiscus sinensis]|uniref:ovomucoid-like n=1 Tax=Pelodiscus sinensis TaxID=13735 RepID=UPI003F6C5FB9
MKISGAVLLFSLAFSCLYLDAAGQIEEDMCSMYDYPPEYCSPVYSPICATDGTTYGNECEFCAAYLTDPEYVSFAYYGECYPYDDAVVARTEL